MGYNIDCFKEYEIKNMMDWSGDHEIVMLDKCSGDYIYPSILSKINNYLEKYNLEILYNLVPLFNDDERFSDITKKEAERIVKSFKKPTDCLTYVKQNNIIEKINSDNPMDYESMLFTLQNLINKWEQGYYVYVWY